MNMQLQTDTFNLQA